jgi:hypothetical protein
MRCVIDGAKNRPIDSDSGSNRGVFRLSKFSFEKAQISDGSQSRFFGVRRKNLRQKISAFP